jgi:diguanylate cyclase (GGDEF)-like protein
MTGRLLGAPDGPVCAPVEKRDCDDFGSPAKRWRHSLAIQVARNMVLWACINTLILTAIGYMFVFARVEQRTLAYLGGYMTERLRAEDQVFTSSEEDISKLEKRFLDLYRDPHVLPDPKFDSYFVKSPDGVLRMREKFYTGTPDDNGLRQKSMSAFVIGNGRPPTDEFKRRIVLTYKLIGELGPAWQGQFANLYAALPENAGVIYWPGVPWGLRVGKDRVQKEQPTWTPLYFDPVAQRWNVSYQRAVRLNGRVLIYPGHDILLDDLMSRLIKEHPAGAYNLILAKDGDLIAHPDRLNDIKRNGRGPNVATLADPGLKSIYRFITADARQPTGRGGVRIIEDPQIDAYICFGEIKGPGWWFVTIYPRSLVLSAAREAANGLLLLGLASFGIMTLIVLWVLHERVAGPVSQMRIASERVYSGDYEAVADGLVSLPETEDNEIGIFAQSFRGMAKRIRDTRAYLEEMVLHRTQELQKANEELERLSFRDGLTGAYNRRSFDKDLEAAISTAAIDGTPASLLLCDIDFFKQFNDTYGHLAGDNVLRLVAHEMIRRADKGSVYRYGGEELAVLFRGIDPEVARVSADAIIAAIARLAIPHETSTHGVVTTSGGLVEVDPRQSAHRTIEAADALLYRAKTQGRNRLMCSERQKPSRDRRAA